MIGFERGALRATDIQVIIESFLGCIVAASCVSARRFGLVACVGSE
jgi:hypothetical protein